MINIKVTENEENQRLDRFLKKYFKNSSLSFIYKLIRKDVKINGKRVAAETFLKLDDEINIYISQDEAEILREKKELSRPKKQFKIAYEDENMIIVEKPFGLLTHGDKTEKKNTLANQVVGYLIEKGDYKPAREKTFMPSPVNRLDRNTSGLVIFGKNNKTLQSLNKMMREKGYIRKYYLTIIQGELKRELVLKDKMTKDEKTNTVSVISSDSEEGKMMETIAKPLKTAKGYTLVEVLLVTGRTHQIRAHLSKAGYPVIGDVKYGWKQDNKGISKNFNISTQLLHAYKLCFDDAVEPIEYMKNKEVRSEIPDNFKDIKSMLFEK